MTSIKFMALGLAITGIGLTSFINKSHTKRIDNKGFAVVELFTSEGCSDCPPADAVVAKIEKESADKPVYILAFHVDYWNRLGWKDVFSTSEYSRRQNQYAKWLHLSSVYTPQVVVNGSKEFVGSEEGTLRNTIKTDLQSTAGAHVSLGDVKVEGNKANLQYKAEGDINNSTLLVAVIERSATSKVERGENGGRTLSHVQIVRGFINVPARLNGSATVTLPSGFNAEDYELIAFVQNTSTGVITGATKSAFGLAL